MGVLSRIWGALWRFGRVAWVCRVSAASVIAGGLLVAYTVQARDLFADLGIKAWQWAVFVFLVFCWAMIVHAEARRALQNDDWVPESQTGELSYDRRRDLQKKYWTPALQFPRLLSFFVFFFVGFAIFRVYLNLHDAAEGLPEAAQADRLALYLLLATIVAAAVYAYIFWKRRDFEYWIVKAPSGEPVQPPKWSREPPLLAGTAPLFAKLTGYKRHTPAVDWGPTDYFRFIVGIVSIPVLLFMIWYPHFFADQLPRLFFIPVLFGGAVVFLAEVAAWSMRLQTPFLLGIAALALVMVFLTPSFHDTRWIETTAEPSKAAGDTRQISLADAVKRWQAANSCAGDVSLCPRPILIAGAGGASRAGFLTATITGALIDLGGDIRSRIFALSTVSGSSAGAVIMRAALLDAAAGGDPNKPPCKTAGTGSWFGKPLMASDKAFDPMQNWRDCFQAILAGDFLSPIFIALAYRDNFPFINPLNGRPAWSDRAVLLEQAFERRYHRFTTQTGDSVPCADQPPPQADSEGLCRPFGYHPDPKVAGAWIPLFFINGTSVFTGRRIVIGDVPTADAYLPDGANAALMPLAYDINDLRVRKPNSRDNETDLAKGSDIRLSTAATMSARFPIISPQGLLRTVYGDVTDQIVDGGYFENDGLATIADVAVALKAFKLDPAVIRIVNEPSKPEDLEAGKTRPPPPAVMEKRSLFDDLLAPGRALVASRSGHEDEYAVLLKKEVLTNPSRLYEIGVYELAPPESDAPSALRAMPRQTNPICRREVKNRAKMENVSMSWWMSQPVQAYLDAQLCLPANWKRLECELREGRTAAGGDCP
jgi:hypothetical protein